MGEHELQPEIQGSQHPEPSAKGKRDPRIFFGTTTTSTSALSTATLCYTTAGITSSCSTGKKKRSLMLENPIEGYTYHLDSGRQKSERIVESGRVAKMLCAQLLLKMFGL